LYQGAGVIAKKIFATENALVSSAYEYASVSVNRSSYTIPSGITWVTRTSNFGTTRIRSVAYGNGLWVAAGATGQIRTENSAERAFKLKATVTNANFTGSEATAIVQRETVVA
jgi:hypothetical protein